MRKPTVGYANRPRSDSMRYRLRATGRMQSAEISRALLANDGVIELRLHAHEKGRVQCLDLPVAMQFRIKLGLLRGAGSPEPFMKLVSQQLKPSG